MFKKFISMMLVAVLAIGVVMSVPGKEASAASTSKQVTLYNFTNAIGSIHTSEDYYSVKVSVVAGYTWLRQKWDWTMELQRYEGGTWKTIGTRTGYVAYQDDSHRTFTNIAKKNAPMRVKITFQPFFYFYDTGGGQGWGYNRGPFVHYSKTWTR